MRHRVTAVSIVALSAVLATSSGAQENRDRTNTSRHSSTAPAVDVWLEDVSFQYGERVRPFFASEHGAYVTVVRVTTDGELRVLYPRRPSEQRLYTEGALSHDAVPYDHDPASRIYEPSGIGFVFAIASFDRFDFRYYTSGSGWSIARLAGARNQDPFSLVRQFVSRTLPVRADFSMDYVSYEVYGNAHRNTYSTVYSSAYLLSNYYDLCVTAFGRRYTGYCGTFDDRYQSGYRRYGSYYSRYPYGVGRGRTGYTAPLVIRPKPHPRMKPRDPVGDPVISDLPVERQSREARDAFRWRTESAGSSRIDDQLRGRRTDPRVEAREFPRWPAERQVHPEPRPESRFEGRMAPRERIDMPRSRIDSHIGRQAPRQ